MFTTTAAPQSSILGVGQEAAFTKQITSDHLGGYAGKYNYKVEIANSIGELIILLN